MRTLLTFFLTTLVLASAIGQKKLTMYKTFGSVVYQMDTLTLSSKQLMMVLKENPEAYNEFKFAKSKSTISSVMGFTGGLLIALPLVTAVAGGQPEWIYAGAGTALVLASIPFYFSYRGHALNALDIYNATLPSSKIKIKTTLYFTGTSATIAIRF